MEWIECKLKWSDSGYSFQEHNALNEKFEATLDVVNKDIENIIGKAPEENFDEFNKYSKLKYDHLDNDGTEENWLSFVNDRPDLKRIHDDIIAAKEYHLRYNELYSEYSDVKEYLRAQDELYANDKAMAAETFVGKGLARPGTVIELENGKIHVIGSINTVGGVCDDCVDIRDSDIIVRYAVVYDWKDKPNDTAYENVVIDKDTEL